MNNDTISREALKTEIEKVSRFNDGTYKWLYLNGVYNAIDNAPTVEGFTKEDMSGAYNEGYACGSRENERPQGEWKLDSIGAYCSICETHPDYATNFCPNCGADMRKGGAEK